jgi:aspartyl protease family protein
MREKFSEKSSEKFREPAKHMPLPKPYRLLCALLLLPLCEAAGATSVNVVGLFPGKAVVSIDGGPPRTLSPESSIAGVKLLSTTGDSATFVIDGKRQTLHIGQYYAGQATSGRASTTLVANGAGHYVTQGFVNGGSINFVVDTGATLVTMSASEAKRLGINYKEGQLAIANTANGQVAFYRVRPDTVKVGDIVLNNVEAGVQESGMTSTALLGMSFLGRTEISRDGANMVLTKRF